jgi:tetratricopeptide (TPR) repeat protein
MRVHRAMRSLLSRATQGDTSFSIGLGLIVILAVAEIFAATFYYVGRARAARASAQAIAASLVRPTTTTPAASTTSALAPAQPGQSPEPAAPTPLPSLLDQLLREGIELRERGDTTTALARLQEASDSDPTNAAVLEEIAKTYEAMQLFDRSNEMWHKLQEMGPSAGEAYELADQRLKLGVPTPGTAGAGIASASLDPATQHKDVGGGIAEGSTFSITEVKTTETPDPDAETNLALQIGIRKQPDATIDYTKVKIQVFFYDTVDNRDIKLTDADVNYEWLTPKHDWTDTNPEILSVSYLRPKTRVVAPEAALSEAAASVKPGQKGRPAKSSTAGAGERKYLGYRILLYYDDKLQAVQAEPARLLQLFPPSENISPP